MGGLYTLCAFDGDGDDDDVADERSVVAAVVYLAFACVSKLP